MQATPSCALALEGNAIAWVRAAPDKLIFRLPGTGLPALAWIDMRADSVGVSETRSQLFFPGCFLLPAFLPGAALKTISAVSTTAFLAASLTRTHSCNWSCPHLQQLQERIAGQSCGTTADWPWRAISCRPESPYLTWIIHIFLPETLQKQHPQQLSVNFSSRTGLHHVRKKLGRRLHKGAPQYSVWREHKRLWSKCVFTSKWIRHVCLFRIEVNQRFLQAKGIKTEPNIPFSAHILFYFASKQIFWGTMKLVCEYLQANICLYSMWIFDSKYSLECVICLKFGKYSLQNKYFDAKYKMNICMQICANMKRIRSKFAYICFKANKKKLRITAHPNKSNRTFPLNVYKLAQYYTNKYTMQISALTN